MAETTRSSVLAIQRETTEGTLIKPDAAGDYLAIQDDISMDPAFEQLQSAEIRASIGESPSAQGLEQPAASFSHYLRHSGVEGQAPNYGLLLESAFGATSSNGTERLTAAASTTSLLKLAAGGTDFARGKGVLVKNATGGYELRPVDSVDTNDLTLGFNLDNAPGAGLGAGKCVNYSPANTGHPSFSMWLFRGDGGGIEAMAGCKVLQVQIDIQAGQYINAAYQIEGTSFYFNPIEITATDTKLDFTDDDGTWAATITAKIYRDPHELASALQAAMRAASTEDATVVYLDASGKFKITSTGAVLSLLWNTGANTANTIGDKIGFSIAADDSGTAAATGYTSDTAQDWAKYHTPSYDSADPLVAKDNEVFIGDADDNTCFCAQSINFTLANEKSNIECICAESGVQGSIFNRRTVTIDVVGLMERHDADKWQRMRNNADTKFLFNFGVKSGGNWVAGKCGMIYVPTAKVQSFRHGDSDGSVTVELTLKAFVNSSGQGEVYINYL